MSNAILRSGNRSKNRLIGTAAASDASPLAEESSATSSACTTDDPPRSSGRTSSNRVDGRSNEKVKEPNSMCPV